MRSRTQVSIRKSNNLWNRSVDSIRLLTKIRSSWTGPPGSMLDISWKNYDKVSMSFSQRPTLKDLTEWHSNVPDLRGPNSGMLFALYSRACGTLT